MFIKESMEQKRFGDVIHFTMYKTINMFAIGVLMVLLGFTMLITINMEAFSLATIFSGIFLSTASFYLDFGQWDKSYVALPIDKAQVVTETYEERGFRDAHTVAMSY